MCGIEVLYQSGSCRRPDTIAGRVAACRESLFCDDVCRYGTGTGAFLLPVYGGGEMPQAFCRVAAVAGATYVLRQGIREFIVDEGTGRCTALKTESGQVLFTPSNSSTWFLADVSASKVPCCCCKRCAGGRADA